jgi:hypothetical protein
MAGWPNRPVRLTSPSAAGFPDRPGAQDNPVVAHLLGFRDHPGGVQQGLRWNAADVQADAAQTRIALDQDRFLPQVSGTECRRVAAWTRSQDEDLCMDDALRFGHRAWLGSRRWRLHRRFGGLQFQDQ